MEPLPETRDALAEFVAVEGPDPEELLRHLEAAVSRLVPSLVGISVSLVKDRLTFTLVATNEELAALDGLQYLDSGPCVDVALGRDETARVTPGDPLDEQRWRLFAQATAAHGVASTLSLPLYAEGELAGSVNLYAADEGAFTHRADDLAVLVGALPAEAVTNADLSFATRQEAVESSRRLRDRHIIETAVGLVAGDKGIDTEQAREELMEAAARAGVRAAQLAHVVVNVYTRRSR